MICKINRKILLALSVFVLFPRLTHAQISGNRATEMSANQRLTQLSVAAVNSHIAIEGTCQKRVTPTSIRLIWAVTSEEKDAMACHKSTKAKIAKTTTALASIGIGNEKIFEDFISAIPRFEWIEGERNALVETQSGYRMQTNLHIAVETNEQATKVVEAALNSGLTDLIGVDYTADLTQSQNDARLGAIAAAKKKSEVLLSAIFDEQPNPINVQEQTQVRLPAEMYDSFQNVATGYLATAPFGDQRNHIFAYRPKNTYYAGQTKAADDKSYALPMEPEIVVESTVVIYYQSPSSRAVDDEKD